MKMLEHVEEELVEEEHTRQRVEIDEMQCGFMLGCGTTDAIFIVRQLQEKHLIANKFLYMAFVYLEKKAFDCVHHKLNIDFVSTLATLLPVKSNGSNKRNAWAYKSFYGSLYI